MKASFIKFTKEEIILNNNNIDLVELTSTTKNLVVVKVVFDNGTLLTVIVILGSFDDPTDVLYKCTTIGRSINHEWSPMGRLKYIDSVKENIIEHINTIDSFVTREKENKLTMKDLRTYDSLFQ